MDFKNLRLTFLILFFSFFSQFINANINQCPEIAGKYINCTNNDTPLEGEIIIEQDQKNEVMIYHVQFPDPWTSRERRETFTMNGQKESRQEVEPESGIKLTIETEAKCVDQSIIAQISVSKYSVTLGKLKTEIKKTENGVHAILSGNYIKDQILQHIYCENI